MSNFTPICSKTAPICSKTTPHMLPINRQAIENINKDTP